NGRGGGGDCGPGPSRHRAVAASGSCGRDRRLRGRRGSGPARPRLEPGRRPRGGASGHLGGLGAGRPLAVVMGAGRSIAVVLFVAVLGAWLASVGTATGTEFRQLRRRARELATVASVQRRMLGLLWPYRTTVAGGLGITVAATLVGLAQPWPTKI